jgi:DNA-binding NarL/FixJ family response regulator
MRRVLVIEDHAPSRDILKRALVASRCEIVGEGSSGRSALQLASVTVPEVIFTAKAVYSWMDEVVKMGRDLQSFSEAVFEFRLKYKKVPQNMAELSLAEDSNFIGITNCLKLSLEMTNI